MTNKQVREQMEQWAAWIESRFTAAGIQLSAAQRLALVLALTLDGAKLPETAPVWIKTV